jgi:DNA-directed RNA polymerase specialized sigma24 family protein
MTYGQTPGVDDLRSAQAEPCPCGHGDVAAEIAHGRPLLGRAAGGDPGAFAQLYDENVDDIYRDLLAWTADEATARELTEQVFVNALTWLPVIADGDGDLSTWLLTSARDAVVQDRGPGWAAADRPGQPAPDVLLAFDQLDDAHREVVVLRLLLGHSLSHTAHLAGYPPRAVGDLQLAACASIWELLSGAPIEPGQPAAQEQRPRWFEHCLEGAYLDPGGDSALQDVMAVADALRQAAPQQVPLPDDGFVQRLRQGLLAEMGGAAPAGQRPTGAGLAGAFATLRYHIGRHPWAATIVAAGAIGLIFGLQVAGGGGTRSACGDGPCATSASDTTVSDQAGVGAPTIPTLGATTVFSTTTAPPTTQPPSTQPPTTAPATGPPTTRAPTTTARPTTTRRPTTTTTEPPTTTSPATTTTRDPGPP